MKIRKKQCKACPWRKSTKPEQDITGGYCSTKHAALENTMARPGEINLGAPLRMMACHESKPESEYPCVGWLMHQLGPGNNIALRLQARDGRFFGLRVIGPQHATLADTLPKDRA